MQFLQIAGWVMFVMASFNSVCTALKAVLDKAYAANQSKWEQDGSNLLGKVISILSIVIGFASANFKIDGSAPPAAPSVVPKQ